MKLTTALQIFLLVDVFIAGVVASTAVRHGLAHFRLAKPDKKKNEPTPGELSRETRDHLLKEAAEEFQESLSHTTGKLQADLAATAEKINNLLEHVGTEIVSKEMESYRTDLVHLRKESHVSQIGEEIARHEAELKAKLAEDIAADKQRLIEQIDTKLADAVTGFLIDTLQHNVDLGAQAAYLTAQLEEHKAELVKGVSDEV